MDIRVFKKITRSIQDYDKNNKDHDDFTLQTFYRLQNIKELEKNEKITIQKTETEKEIKRMTVVLPLDGKIYTLTFCNKIGNEDPSESFYLENVKIEEKEKILNYVFYTKKDRIHDLKNIDDSEWAYYKISNKFDSDE